MVSRNRLFALERTIPLYELCMKAAGKETGDELCARIKEESKAAKIAYDANKRAEDREKNIVRLLREKWA